MRSLSFRRVVELEHIVPLLTPARLSLRRDAWRRGGGI